MIQEATDQEVKHILDTDWDSHYDMLDYLMKQGFKEVGSGAYSVVLSKRGYRRLIKVRYKSIGIGSGGLHYYRYCKKNARKNPYLPKVYHIKGDDPDFYAIVTEKLIVKGIDSWFIFDKYLNDDDRAILTYFKFKDYKRVNLGVYEKAKKQFLDRKLDNHILWKTLMYLENRFGDIDINPHNVLLRERNNHPVLMDPVLG